ncbi:MAG TPA: 1-acyl-sn-glycerol-3-phosphate acyltransferase, partial [Candidatus Hydrogenedentes bacterium]|nr:1-acyl-sn-glycerol-3-phosphate acyltransferase [Candidatus Hydrogenedentota bacterium]
IPLFGRFLKWLGGIPIDRSRPNGVVGQCVELLKAHEDLILAVPPEGTRKKVKAWKTGFYHIALGAGVPIALGYLDYGRRRGGVMCFFHPTGDYEADVRAIQERYRHITPKYPELSSLADEAEKD